LLNPCKQQQQIPKPGVRRRGRLLAPPRDAQDIAAGLLRALTHAVHADYRAGDCSAQCEPAVRFAFALLGKPAASGV